MSVAHSALLTYNAALNRTTFQSSVQSEPSGTYIASLANDGIRETNAYKDDTPSCFTSQNETNPWWAVDLGGPTTIYRVDLTNIGDPHGTYSYFVWRFVRLSYCLVLFILYKVEVSNVIL